jgi:nucleotide-binding universal stress UspA family protein
MRTNQVIVGVDGSVSGRAALRWAAAEATHRGLSLRVIHAYHAHRPDRAVAPNEAETKARELAEKVHAAAVADARTHAPDVPVTGGYALGGAAETLLVLAHPGDLLVVGSRGHAGFGAALIGSTSQQVALHARVPVVVVRGRADTAAGPVAVGYDGSASADYALELAFEHAVARGCGLTVVRAFGTLSPAWPIDMPPPPVADAQAAKAALLDDLTSAVRPWTDKYPDVAVERLVTVGDAAKVLVEVSRGTRLLVVGSRGHGGFAGLLLGSVGLHLLHHAHCPVLIARTAS